MSTLSSQLIKKIDATYEQVLKNLSFLVMTRQGQLTKKQLITFLYATYYFARRTENDCMKARVLASRKGLAQLGSFYLSKIAEERGHYMWAIEDLNKQGVSESDMHSIGLTHAQVDFFLCIDAGMQEHPALYLIYQLMAEQLNAKASPEWLEDLEQCGIDRSEVTMMENHAGLDGEHVNEDCAMIDLCVQNEQLPLNPERALSYLDELFSHYIRFLEEVMVHEHTFGDRRTSETVSSESRPSLN